MKQFLLIACLSFFTLGLSAQVVFVDADATGTGDGSSWENASTDLNVALRTATSGSSVWIADGTYTTPDSVSFFIDKELTVLGGFNGTETSADAADPATNVTILSGDFAGDDPAEGMPFDTAAFVDNNRVLFITDTSSVASQYTVTIDGITIANGGSPFDDLSDGLDLNFAGGGILSFAKVALSRVIFKANRSYYGSALSLVSFTANGSVLDDITFDGNFSGPFRQFYCNGIDDLVVRNSTFDGTDDGQQQSGFFRFVFVTNSLVENCTFTNLSSVFSGAGIRADNSDNITVRSCTFDNLTSSTGSGVYLIQGGDFESVQDEDDFVFDGCTFTNSIAGGDAAAIAAIRTSLKIINSSVANNAAVDGAGVFQIVNDSRSYSLNIDKSTFEDNASSGNFGGAFEVVIFGAANVVGNIDNSVFERNTVAGLGGACFYIQGDNEFTVTNSQFRDNTASVGSVIFTRNRAGLTMKNVVVENNGTSESTSGAITASLDDGATGVSIDSSTFRNNLASENPGFFDGGGAIRFTGGATQIAPLTISNSTFADNASPAGGSGGAINLYRSFALDIDNSTFLNNSASSDGGAINMSRGIASRDTTDAGIITTNLQPATATISNSEFYNQIAGNQGGAISTQRVGIDLTNCVFALNNVGTDGGGGGAIIFNGALTGVDQGNLIENGGSFVQECVLIHNTFVDNQKGGTEAAVGDHIAVFQPGVENPLEVNSFKLTLLNNAFVLSSGAAAIETEPFSAAVPPQLPIGDVLFESLGGNFFSGPNSTEFTAGADDTVEDSPTAATDIFVDPDANVGDFPDVDLLITDPVTNNPLINTALTSALAPDVDVRGNPRGDAPDIGAYEAEWGLVDTDEPIENSSLKLDFFPNPTANVLNIRNDDSSILNYDVLVADQLGRILKAARFGGGNSQIDMTNLPAGIYNLRLMVNGSIYSKQVVKQ